MENNSSHTLAAGNFANKRNCSSSPEIQIVVLDQEAIHNEKHSRGDITFVKGTTSPQCLSTTIPSSDIDVVGRTRTCADVFVDADENTLSLPSQSPVKGGV